MGTPGNLMEAWEIAQLRRSRAMAADTPIDPDTLTRILATLEAWAAERTQVRVLLDRVGRARTVGEVRRAVGELRDLAG